ncbi:MAG TPA: tRNA-guanine transglycosylase, partial [Candidatus Absconditabacterales bacterium]|nr:tRNA-guanine transglycosylase [Candidatus Absconditabacterales bacterium]
IEIDGNTHWSKKEIEYDNKRTKKLESYGLRVVRFTNNEIFENIEGVYLKLQEYIKPPLTPPIKRGMHQHNVDIKLVEDGVHFRSPYDGSKHFFSPEKVVDIQCNLGSDIMMVLDVCSPGNSDKKTLYSQMQQTHRWAKRAYDHFMKKYDKVKGVLFPIVQGGTDLEMRKESAEYLSQFATDGIAIGGVSVGESKEKVREVVEFTTPLLPNDKPRYLMGVGTPEDLLHAIEHGVDMFDCVLATRLGRHGVAFSDKGNVNLNNAKFKEDFTPLDDTVEGLKNYSKSYINHLLKENEMLGGIILSLHNILYLHKILENWKKKFLED